MSPVRHGPTLKSVLQLLSAKLRDIHGIHTIDLTLLLLSLRKRAPCTRQLTRRRLPPCRRSEKSPCRCHPGTRFTVTLRLASCTVAHSGTCTSHEVTSLPCTNAQAVQSFTSPPCNGCTRCVFRLPQLLLGGLHWHNGTANTDAHRPCGCSEPRVIIYDKS